MLLPIRDGERGHGASSLKGFISSAHKICFRAVRFYEAQGVFSSVSGGGRKTPKECGRKLQHVSMIDA